MNPPRHEPTITRLVVVTGKRAYRVTRRRKPTGYQRAWGALCDVETLSQNELRRRCDERTWGAERLASAETQRVGGGPSSPAWWEVVRP